MSCNERVLNAKHQQIISVVALIPGGSVASYGQVADLAGLPGRARLVGKVLRNSPTSDNLPWHRVLKSSGHLAFEAHSESAKCQSNKLRSEGVVVKRNRVDMTVFRWNPSLDDILHRLQH